MNPLFDKPFTFDRVIRIVFGIGHLRDYLFDSLITERIVTFPDRLVTGLYDATVRKVLPIQIMF